MIWQYLAWIFGTLWLVVALLLMWITIDGAVEGNYQPVPITVELIFDLFWPISAIWGWLTYMRGRT